MNIQLHGDETETGDSENVKTTKGARSSKRLQSTQDSDDEHSDADLGDGENLFEESKSQQPTRSSSAKVLKDKLKSQQLAAFLADISVCIDLLANQSDEYVLNIGAELLMTIQFLCTVKPEFAGICWIRMLFFCFS